MGSELNLITAPVCFPVSVDDAKTYANLAGSGKDGTIRQLISLATNYIEAKTARRLVTQTWKLFLYAWPEKIILPYGRLQSVTSVKYKDSDGNESTFSDTKYIVDTDSEPGRIVLVDGESWPGDALYNVNPVYIAFTCGYYAGDTWAASTAYAENDIILPATINGLAYECTSAGTSNATEPTWPRTIGGTVVDNGATWTAKGPSVPEQLRTAIKLIVNDLFSNRETEIFNMSFKKLDTIKNLVDPYQIDGFFT
jgi:uncharacterized phiE125 gp8 family phage protein